MSNLWTGKSILIIDDNQEARTELSRVFTDIGLKVIATPSSAQEGLEILKTTKPDFISLDIIMPDMDGIECYFKISELELDSKAFFVSALSSDPRVVAAYSGRISELCFFPKPLNSELATKLFNKLIQGSNVTAVPEIELSL